MESSTSSSMHHTVSHQQHKQLGSSGNLTVSRAADIRPNLSASTANPEVHNEDDTSTSASDNFRYLLRPEDTQHDNSVPAVKGQPYPQQMTAHKPLSRQTTLASTTSTAVPTPTPTRRHPPRPPTLHRHQSAPSPVTNDAGDLKETMIPADPFADSPSTSPTMAQPDLFDQLRELMTNVGNSELIAAKLAAVTAAATSNDPLTPVSPPPTATEPTHWHPVTHRPIPPPLRLSHASASSSATPPNTATSPRSWSARHVPPPKRQLSSTSTQQSKAASELQLPHHPPPPVPPSPAASASASAISRFRGGLISPPPVTPARQISGSPLQEDACAPVHVQEQAALAAVSPVSLASSMSSSSSSAAHGQTNGGKVQLPSSKEQKRTLSASSAATSASVLREQQVKRYTSKLEKEKKNLLDHIHHASSTAHSLSTLLSQAHAHNDSLLRTLEDRELALHASERTLAKRDRDVHQLAAQLKAAQAEVAALAARLDHTTSLLNEVQAAAYQQVQAMAEDRDVQVSRARGELVEVGERWQERVREVEGRLACKDAAVAVVQAQRREVVEMWGGVVKTVVGMVNAGDMGGVDIGQVDIGGGNDVGEEDLGSVLRAGMAVTEWLTRACNQVANAYRDVCGQLHATTELADASKARISQLESELAHTADQLTLTRAQLDTMQSADSELTGSLRTQLVTVTADRDSLHADLTVIRHQLAATANERDHFSTDLARLQAELADAKSNHARMAGDLAMAKKLLEAERKYRRDHSAVQAELADVQSQLAQVQAERAADQQQLADEQTRRKAETGQLMAAVVEAQREVAQLREKLAGVQGGDALLRSASRPASPAMSVPTTPLSAQQQQQPPTVSTASGKGGYAGGGLGGFDSANHGGMTASSPADSLSSTIARLQQRLNRSGNGELGSATSSPTSARAVGI